MPVVGSGAGEFICSFVCYNVLSGRIKEAGPWCQRCSKCSLNGNHCDCHLIGGFSCCGSNVCGLRAPERWEGKRCWGGNGYRAVLEGLWLPQQSPGQWGGARAQLAKEKGAVSQIDWSRDLSDLSIRAYRSCVCVGATARVVYEIMSSFCTLQVIHVLCRILGKQD